MIVKADRLTRRYGPTVAVSDLSFEIERGDIVGLLGPNGAGKSSTMRMMAGYLAPTSGRISVAGYDVFSRSLDVRRRIGYLPENVPLYPEMRVIEYLTYRARLKRVPRRTRAGRVAEVMERCGVGPVRRKLIGALSKGYRQRVGLADALMGKPDVLILDEPTIGLDPIQVRHVRALIRSLAGERTVLLSTHILPEVEMICRRVLVIASGRLVFQDTLENIARRGAGGARVVMEARLNEHGPDCLRNVEGVLDVQTEPLGDFTRITLRIPPEADPREALCACAARHGWALREVRLERPSLEELFVRLTAGEEER